MSTISNFYFGGNAHPRAPRALACHLFCTCIESEGTAPVTFFAGAGPLFSVFCRYGFRFLRFLKEKRKKVPCLHARFHAPPQFFSPCSMCSGAIRLYRIPKVVIGENKTFRGDEDILKANGVELVVLQDSTCIEMMTGFIESNPVLWNEDIGV